MKPASEFESAAVVIPARNEERTISNVVNETLRAVRRVIVVDDCSEDRTRIKAIESGAHVVTPTSRLGYGGALLTGWRTALTTGASMIFTIDGDGAHDPSDIPQLGRIHLEQGADLTLGNRFSENGRFPVPETKRWANLVAATLVNRCLNIGLSDAACGFRVLSDKLVSTLLEKEMVADFSLAFCCLAEALRPPFSFASGPISVRYDASRPFLTQSNEMLNLISWLTRNASEQSLRLLLDSLLETIIQARPISFVISKILICAHPVGKDGYFFQRQIDPLMHLSCGKILYLDKPGCATVSPHSYELHH